MFLNRYIFLLFICIPVCLQAGYGVQYLTERNNSTCNIEMQVFLYPESDCITDYFIEVSIDGVDVSPIPPDGGWTVGIHSIFFDREGNYEVIISDNLTSGDGEAARAAGSAIRTYLGITAATGDLGALFLNQDIVCDGLDPEFCEALQRITTLMTVFAVVGDVSYHLASPSDYRKMVDKENPDTELIIKNRLGDDALDAWKRMKAQAPGLFTRAEVIAKIVGKYEDVLPEGLIDDLFVEFDKAVIKNGCVRSSEDLLRVLLDDNIALAIKERNPVKFIETLRDNALQPKHIGDASYIVNLTPNRVRGFQALNNLEPGLSSQIAEVDIVARHLDNLPDQTVADIISDANNTDLGTLVTTNYEKWKRYWINRAIKVGEDNLTTGQKLRAYGYPRSADAWKSAGSSIHKTNNKNSLKNNTDPLIPDPVTQYEIDVIDSQGNITTLRKDDPTVKWEVFFKDSGLDWEVHHVLPKSLFKSEGFAKWYEDVGHEIFDINAHTSVVRLEKVDGLRGVHDNHLRYNRILRDFFDSRYREALRLNNNDRFLASVTLNSERRTILSNLKKMTISECLKKPTFTNSGVYNQKPVNELLDDFDLLSLLNP